MSTSVVTPRTPNLKINTIALLCILQRLNSLKFTNSRSKSRLLRQSVTLKGKCLNVFEYIYHQAVFNFSSSVWHFAEPPHLTVSLLQLLRASDSE
jgi:hypothetical protein